jgi:hypothetical protein
MGPEDRKPPEYGEPHHKMSSVVGLVTYLAVSTLMSYYLGEGSTHTDESNVFVPLQYFIIPFMMGLAGSHFKSTLLTPNPIGLPATMLTGLALMVGVGTGVGAILLTMQGILGVASYGLGYHVGKLTAYKKGDRDW